MSILDETYKYLEDWRKEFPFTSKYPNYSYISFWGISKSGKSSTLCFLKEMSQSQDFGLITVLNGHTALAGLYTKDEKYRIKNTCDQITVKFGYSTLLDIIERLWKLPFRYVLAEGLLLQDRQAVLRFYRKLKTEFDRDIYIYRLRAEKHSKNDVRRENAIYSKNLDWSDINLVDLDTRETTLMQRVQGLLNTHGGLL